MSKKIRPRAYVVHLLLVLLASSLLWADGGGVSVLARRTQQAATVSSKSAAVVAATEEVLSETSELRKLPVLRQVRSGAQSREEIERMIVKNLDEETTPEEMRATEAALKKYGLAPADFRLRPFIVGLLTEQVAGYYDPKTQEFYLADWIDVEGQKPVMAHELVHALQDQHFNLRRFEKWPKGDSDAELAAQALVEGDASLVMLYYVRRNPSRAASMMKSLSESGAASEQIDRAPRALRETLLFPYEQGSLFAAQLYGKGGWESVSRAFNKLPQSTEQILHAEKYFASETPVKVDLPNLAPLLGVRWKRTSYNVNGEWRTYLILDEYLKATARSKAAAAGWAGDRFALYEEPRTAGVVLAQMTVWDTERDAAEFFDAYAKRTALRYREALPTNTPHDGANVRSWRTHEGAVVLEHRGSRVAILEGVPKKTNTKELMRALWQ